ncbi:unnamed protein product [Prorocentrum cordatum]|uniref:Thioredoxin domain-containing protein n=1 Tax=Prorocentrum cordatum TaxID=2364126 RepID=A0ABN9T2B1_9DINO|nr:unnamed protein product [Polarella glacialis]
MPVLRPGRALLAGALAAALPAAAADGAPPGAWGLRARCRSALAGAGESRHGLAELLMVCRSRLPAEVPSGLSPVELGERPWSTSTVDRACGKWEQQHAHRVLLVAPERREQVMEDWVAQVDDVMKQKEQPNSLVMGSRRAARRMLHALQRSPLHGCPGFLMEFCRSWALADAHCVRFRRSSAACPGGGVGSQACLAKLGQEGARGASEQRGEMGTAEVSVGCRLRLRGFFAAEAGAAVAIGGGWWMVSRVTIVAIAAFTQQGSRGVPVAVRLVLFAVKMAPWLVETIAAAPIVTSMSHQIITHEVVAALVGWEDVGDVDRADPECRRAHPLPCSSAATAELDGLLTGRRGDEVVLKDGLGRVEKGFVQRSFVPLARHVALAGSLLRGVLAKPFPAPGLRVSAQLLQAFRAAVAFVSWMTVRAQAVLTGGSSGQRVVLPTELGERAPSLRVAKEGDAAGERAVAVGARACWLSHDGCGPAGRCPAARALATLRRWAANLSPVGGMPVLAADAAPPPPRAAEATRPQAGEPQRRRAARAAAVAVVLAAVALAAAVPALVGAGSPFRPQRPPPGRAAGARRPTTARRQQAERGGCPVEPPASGAAAWRAELAAEEAGGARAPAAGTVLPGASIDVVQAALSEGKPVLVDFMAPRCPSCRRLDEVLDAFADYFGDRVQVLRVNVLEHRHFLDQLGFSRVPAVFLFEPRSGQPVDSFVGAQAKGLDILRSIEEKLLA